MIICCIFENDKPDPYRKYNQKHYLMHKAGSKRSTGTARWRRAKDASATGIFP